MSFLGPEYEAACQLIDARYPPGSGFDNATERYLAKRRLLDEHEAAYRRRARRGLWLLFFTLWAVGFVVATVVMR